MKYDYYRIYGDEVKAYIHNVHKPVLTVQVTDLLSYYVDTLTHNECFDNLVAELKLNHNKKVSGESKD